MFRCGKDSKKENMRFNKLEFGKKGPEGLKGEGIDETNGWASLGQEVPFSGGNITKQDNRINEPLRSIDLPEFESGQDTRPEADMDIGSMIQEAEKTHDDVQKQIESMKANINSIFGDSPDPISAQVPDYNSRPVAPRTPPAETATNFNLDPFYPANHGNKESETNQIFQPEKSDAEIEQFKRELAETGAKFAEALKHAEQLKSSIDRLDDAKERLQGFSEQDNTKPQAEPITQEQEPQEIPVEQEKPATLEADDESSLKNETVNRIVSRMLDAGEFQNSGLDISQKMRDIEYAKKKLQDKTLEELRILLSTYE